MDISKDSLIDRYKSLEDYELVELYNSGDLTEFSKEVLVETMNNRSIDIDNIEELKSKNKIVESTEYINWNKVTKNYPKVWVGYLLIVLLYISLAISIPEDLRFGPRENLILIIGSFSLLGYWLYCIHRLHWILAEATGNRYPISHGRAAGFHLIPFFNFYWSFKWTKEMGKFLKLAHGKSQVGSWLGLVIIFGFLASKLIDFSVGYILLFLVAGICNQEIKKVARYNQG